MTRLRRRPRASCHGNRRAIASSLAVLVFAAVILLAATVEGEARGKHHYRLRASEYPWRGYSIGAGASAMELLENTHKRHPADRDALLALVSIARETGDFASALTHARELVALYPTDMELRMLILDLEKRQAH
jgi:Flp pilus assembly protein TadD